MASPAAPAQRLLQPLAPIGSMVIGSIIEAAFMRRTWAIASAGRAPRGHAFFIAHGRASFLGRDEATMALEAPFVLWLPSQLRGEFRLEAGGDGMALSIADDFLWRTVGDSGMAAHLGPLLPRMALAPAEGIAAPLPAFATSFAALGRESRAPPTGASPAMCVPPPPVPF